MDRAKKRWQRKGIEGITLRIPFSLAILPQWSGVFQIFYFLTRKHWEEKYWQNVNFFCLSSEEGFFLKTELTEKLGNILGKACAPKPVFSQWSSRIKDMLAFQQETK